MNLTLHERKIALEQALTDLKKENASDVVLKIYQDNLDDVNKRLDDERKQKAQRRELNFKLKVPEIHL